jgi:site-specific recombinase XerD
MVYYPVDWENKLRKECRRRRYSEKTAKTYVYCVNSFLKHCKKDLGKIGKKDVRLFLEHLSEKGKTGNTMNTYHMAIRFLFENVLEKRMWIDIKYSKVPKKLPDYLAKEEVMLLINSIKNGKHRLMVSLLYGAGLRVGELLNLKVEDLHIKEGYGYVRNGKGGKDRLFIIPEKLKLGIVQLIGEDLLEKEDYLFNSNRSRMYSVKTIQEIIRKACLKSGLRKIHPHTLRHSFATHLIEQGNALTEVQSLLGHKSPETTLVYTHLSGKMVNVKSPLD